jgi:post-segregation antitoxin (ccd killing protein)
MGGYVTVSVKVRRDLVEEAKALGVNISEVVRKAIAKRLGGERQSLSEKA